MPRLHSHHTVEEKAATPQIKYAHVKTYPLHCAKGRTCVGAVNSDGAFLSRRFSSRVGAGQMGTGSGGSLRWSLGLFS